MFRDSMTPTELVSAHAGARVLRQALATTVLALAFCALAPAVGFAQSGIAGTVKDSSGAVMPGVTVEAASPALIEKVRTAVSDGQGEYKIVDLRPGVYTVTFTLEGFNTYKRDGIELPSGFTATVNAEMKVGALAETLTVTGQAPLVDVQNVVAGQVMSKAVLDAVPTLRMAQTYMTFIPGVILNASNTSGTLSSGAGGITIHGSRSRDSAVMIDGFSGSNWTNPGGAGFNWIANPGTAAEIVGITGGAKADQDLSGIQSNVIPKEGGNTFNGTIYGHYLDGKWQGDNRTDDMIAKGVQVNGDNRLWDFNPGFGGPVMQNKLWFFGSYRTVGDERTVGNLYNLTPNAWVYTPDPSRPPSAYLLSDRDYSLRLTYQITPRNKFAIYFSQQPRTWRSRDLSATVSPEATTWTPYLPNYLTQATWKSPVSNRLLLEFGVNYTDSANVQACSTDPTLLTGPAGSQPANCYSLASATESAPTNVVARIRSAAQYGWANGRGAGLRWKGAALYITGSHAFKGGFDLQSGSLHARNFHPFDYTVTLRNGAPQSLTLFAPNDLTDHLKADLGLYLQDQWTLKNLTLNLGVRYNWFNGYVNPQDEPGNSIVAAKSYPGVYDVPNWKDIVPRIGIAYDLFGNGRTAVKGTINKYTAGETIGFTHIANPIVTSVLSTTRTWSDANRNFVPDCNLSLPGANGECGPLANASFAQANATAQTNDPAILYGWNARGYNWEVSGAVQQEITKALSVNVAYFRRAYGNISVNDNTRITPANFNSFCVTMPTDSRLPTSGQRFCDFYDVNTTASQVNQTFATNFQGDQFDHYNGFDFTAQFRLPNGAQISGGTSTGREEVSTCSLIDSPGGVPRAGVTDDRAAWCDTKPPFQTQFKLTAVYPVMWGVQVSANFVVSPGPDYSGTTYQVTNAQIAPSLGRNLTAGATATVNVPLMPRGSLYGDAWSRLDGRFTKSFKIGKTRLSGNVDIINLLNSPGVGGVNNVYNPTAANGGSWLTPTVLSPPRQLRLGGQFDF